MTQTKKDLLLKDLCGRLPYFTKVQIKNEIVVLDSICDDDGYHFNFIGKDREGVNIEEIKPYLFPLSSMTEEQKKEISKRYNYYNPYQSCVLITDHRQGYWDNDDNSCNLQDYLWLEDWFNKNHFDYRGLIPIGAAIDATDLNIY